MKLPAIYKPIDLKPKLNYNGLFTELLHGGYLTQSVAQLEPYPFSDGWGICYEHEDSEPVPINSIRYKTEVECWAYIQSITILE
jgi:hypothetical protein